MRISDWSSDVCSSDLSRGEGEQVLPVARRRVPIRVRVESRLKRVAQRGGGGDGDEVGFQAVRIPERAGLQEFVRERQPGVVVDAQQRDRPVAGHPAGPQRGRAALPLRQVRSEARRVGKEWVRTWRYRWSPCHVKNKKKKHCI